MALAIPFVPNTGLAQLTANGRVYAVAGAATVDVPYVDGVMIGPDQGTRLMVRRHDRSAGQCAGRGQFSAGGDV
jgi:hypothetical protein